MCVWPENKEWADRGLGDSGNENRLIAQLDDGNFNMKCETSGISGIRIEIFVCVSLGNLVDRFSSIFDR